MTALQADAGQKPPAGCLFCPADQPLLRRQTVAALALCAAVNDPAPALWRPAWQGQPGAPVLFPARAYPELRALPEGRGGGAVAQARPGSVRLLPAADEWELADIDTPADRARLEAALAGRQGSGRPKTAE